MGLFFTRIDNKEVSHAHHEQHEKTVKHVRATPGDAHRELKEIKEEARDVLLKQMEVQNTPMGKIQMELRRHPADFAVSFWLIVNINGHRVKMEKSLNVDDETLSSRNSYELVNKMSRFLENNFTESLLKS